MKGLSFSEPMMKAWLAGRKSVTRRLMNPQPDKHFMGGVPFYPGNYEKEINPPYLPGETVYIKETWRCDNPATAKDVYSRGIGLFYKAGMSEEELAIMPTHSWKSSLFMSEWAARSHALIVSVMPERIQEITEEETVKEGFARREHFIRYWEKLHTGSFDRNDWIWRIELERIRVMEHEER